jgi:hypothetical protein
MVEDPDMEHSALARTERVDSNVKNESIFQELAADCWAIGAGIRNGLKSAANDVVEHPGEFAMRMGIVATTGFVLGGMQRSAGVLRFAAEAALVGGAFSAMRNLSNATFTDGALGSRLTQDEKLTQRGENIGRFLFDTAAFTLAGTASAKFSQKMFSNIELSSPQFNSPTMSSFDRLMMDKMNNRW